MKLRNIAAVLVSVLGGLASPSLFAQSTARPLPDDPIAQASLSQEIPHDGDSGEPAFAAQTGSIVGTVIDINGSPVARATVALEGPDLSDMRSVLTNDSGFFEIRDVEAGHPYHVAVRAEGFAEWRSPVVTLEPGQHKILDVSGLRIEEVQTVVTVSPESTEQMAIEQVKTAEKQRIFGVIPNFYEVYTANPAPLTAKLRFSLAFRLARDPFTVAGVAFLSGVGQATNHPEYVQGLKGYGERFGASYADNVTDIFIGGAVLPSLLHQDPRYHYDGKGSTGSRMMHAIATLFVTRNDNGRLEPNYSSFGGDLASAAISNLYYPRSSRGVGLVVTGFATNTAIHLAVRLVDEFVLGASRETQLSVSNADPK